MLGLHVGVQMVSFSIIFFNIVKRLVVDRGFNNTKFCDSLCVIKVKIANIVHSFTILTFD